MGAKDGTGTSGSAMSGLSNIYQINQQRPNLRASYNNTNKNSFYPEIGQQITEGNRAIP
jgi:hypothetical protein